jgi:hypothetical protein
MRLIRQGSALLLAFVGFTPVCKGADPRTDVLFNVSNYETVWREIDGRVSKVSTGTWIGLWLDHDRIILGEHTVPSESYRVIDVQGREIQRISLDQWLLSSSPDGHYLLFVDTSSRYNVFEIATGKIVLAFDRKLFETKNIEATTWSKSQPNRLYVATNPADASHRSQLWRLTVPEGTLSHVGYLDHMRVKRARKNVDEYEVSSMAVSPNDAEIVYSVQLVRYNRSNISYVVRSKIDGVQPKIIYRKGRPWVHEWSSDGEWISIQNCRSNFFPRWSIEFIHSDGSRPTRLNSYTLGRRLFGEYDLNPRWRPPATGN